MGKNLMLLATPEVYDYPCVCFHWVLVTSYFYPFHHLPREDEVKGKDNPESNKLSPQITREGGAR